MTELRFPVEPESGGAFSEVDGILTGSLDMVISSGFGQFSVSDLMRPFRGLPQSFFAIGLIFTVISFKPTRLAVSFKG
jgi:hypothetical protein